MSMDFEMGQVTAVNEVFPRTTVRFCAFHMVRSMRRKQLEIFKIGKVNAFSVTNALSKLLNAIPYVRWDSTLKEVLYKHIRQLFTTYLNLKVQAYEKVKPEHDSITAKQAVDRAGDLKQQCEIFIKYLDEQFLCDTHIFGYTNWGYGDDEEDLTNNQCEQLNHVFSGMIPKNIKTYLRGATCIYDFMQAYISETAEEVSF